MWQSDAFHSTYEGEGVITESELEALALTWFQDTGRDHLHGPDIAPNCDSPERTDYRQTLLFGHFRAVLYRFSSIITGGAKELAA